MAFIKGLIVLFLLIFASLVGIGICFSESEFIFYPLIDTQLPPGFTVQKFDSIKPGMTKADVLKILPAPMSSSDDHNSWYYGQDGAAPFGDFAWFEFTIHFDSKGKVVKTERQKYND
ncbi:hypothetical protein BCD64_26710 [Nostoc sp. MBR 210]|nr:hypothetical protein BCD64_26710 [Nostoc sp. MBR 210]